MLAFIGFGTPEIIIITLGLLLLFGGKKIPELMKGLGGGIKEFKKASTLENDDEKPVAKPKPEDQKA
ncbi:MAG TPA: twin-arginine translocase TatA/TatE family subunit [Patescibacteria group bacterium]|nr:twin-arginine translocase TatA/TatE family subunit [Patescibacteria group bacterium]